MDTATVLMCREETAQSINQSINQMDTAENMPLHFNISGNKLELWSQV